MSTSNIYLHLPDGDGQFTFVCTNIIAAEWNPNRNYHTQ